MNLFRKIFKKYPYSISIFMIFTIFWLFILLYFYFLFYVHTKNSNEIKRQTMDVCTFSFQNTKLLRIDDIVFDVSVVDTPSAMQKGLGGISCLKKTEGMLFMFPEPGIYPFWMKDMNFPIDIVWINASWTIVDITHDFKSESYPNTAAPKKEVKYVLEIPAHLARKYGFDIGDSTLFER